MKSTTIDKVPITTLNLISALTNSDHQKGEMSLNVLVNAISKIERIGNKCNSRSPLDRNFSSIPFQRFSSKRAESLNSFSEDFEPLDSGVSDCTS